MCKTHKIAKELEVKILKHLKGAEVLDVPEHGELEDGSYLVERDGEKFVLKTGKFNDREADDNWDLAEMGIKTRMIFEANPGEYILYEYIDAPLLSTEEYWTDANMQRVFDLHAKIADGLKDRPISDEQKAKGMEWLEKKPLGSWLDEIIGPGCTEQEAEHVREALFGKLELAWAYRDNNADHYIDMGKELAVLDADISLRPKHYMDMRYLAWVMLKMPMDALNLDWVTGWVEKLGNEPPRLRTFLVSLVGVLWDINGNEKHKGEHVEKTPKIKEVIGWIMGELRNKGGQNE